MDEEAGPAGAGAEAPALPGGGGETSRAAGRFAVRVVEKKRVMKRGSAPKRYFYVHLAIFAGMCATFAAAGVSSYKDYRRAEALHARPAPGPGSPALLSGEEGSVLTISKAMGTP
jgi:hypothetical protein